MSELKCRHGHEAAWCVGCGHLVCPCTDSPADVTAERCWSCRYPDRPTFADIVLAPLTPEQRARRESEAAERAARRMPP